jgi:hypothetical protein
VRGQVLRVGLQGLLKCLAGTFEERHAGRPARLAALQPGALEQGAAEGVGDADILREVEVTVACSLETGADNGFK